MPKKLTNPPVKDPILFRPTNPAARATGGPLPTPTTPIVYDNIYSFGLI
jgi:hypothetical protein